MSIMPEKRSSADKTKVYVTVAMVLFLFYAVVDVSAETSKATSDVPAGLDTICLSSEEADLVRLINEYREGLGLVRVSPSKSLSLVARMHSRDLYENKPYIAQDGNGNQCNMHSWSNKGGWSPACYTNDNSKAESMWNKPKEITNNIYTGLGFENVYRTSEEKVSTSTVLERWKNSPAHNVVITESGIWKGMNWPAMGVSIYKNVAVIWFGDKEDPQGLISICP